MNPDQPLISPCSPFSLPLDRPESRLFDPVQHRFSLHLNP